MAFFRGQSVLYFFDRTDVPPPDGISSAFGRPVACCRSSLPFNGTPDSSLKRPRKTSGPLVLPPPFCLVPLISRFSSVLAQFAPLSTVLFPYPGRVVFWTELFVYGTSFACPSFVWSWLPRIDRVFADACGPGSSIPPLLTTAGYYVFPPVLDAR